MGILAGCGQLPMLTAGSGKGALAFKGQGAFGGHEKGHKDGLKNGPFGLLSAVELTAEQKTQLKAIAEKYKPQKAVGPAEKPGAKLKTVVETDPLDVEALRAALSEKPEAPAEAGVPQLEFLKEARGVLTEAQRTTLIEKLKAQPTPAPTTHAARPEPTAEQKQQLLDTLAEKLQLTDTQKAAYAAFQAKLEANRASAERPVHDPAAQRDALVSFLETGDTAGLEALKPAGARPVFPVDEFVALAQSLSVEQRKQLLAGAGGHGGHQGPHGPHGKGHRR
jgi:Spy/CpxP family protein refolding chaperone